MFFPLVLHRPPVLSTTFNSNASDPLVRLGVISEEYWVDFFLSCFSSRLSAFCFLTKVPLLVPFSFFFLFFLGFITDLSKLKGDPVETRVLCEGSILRRVSRSLTSGDCTLSAACVQKLAGSWFSVRLTFFCKFHT